MTKYFAVDKRDRSLFGISCLVGLILSLSYGAIVTYFDNPNLISLWEIGFFSQRGIVQFL